MKHCKSVSQSGWSPPAGARIKALQVDDWPESDEKIRRNLRALSSVELSSRKATPMFSRAAKVFSKTLKSSPTGHAATAAVSSDSCASGGSDPSIADPSIADRSIADRSTNGGADGDAHHSTDDGLASLDDASLRQRLSPEQYHVTQKAGTERAFTGEYWDCHDDGTYRCIVCDVPLFSSNTKYDSGTGWPSFWEAIDPDVVEIRSDRSFGMVREEAVCARCGAHLGHRFNDGPRPTGDRYCMNSASLRLDQATDQTA